MFRKLEGCRLGLAFLSGLLLALAFPKWDIPVFAWLAPGLMLTLAGSQTGRKTFLIGFLAGMGRYLVSLYWFLLMPTPVYAVLAWLGMCSLWSLFAGAWCWTCWRVFPRQVPAGSAKGAQQRTEKKTRQKVALLWPAFCAAAWVAMEMGFAHVLTGFPWTLLGVSQYKWLPLIQVASVLGVYGVSFIVVWVSAGLAAAVLEVRRARQTVRVLGMTMALPLLGLVLALVFGWHRLGAPELARDHLKVALVQPSIPQKVIWDAGEKTNRLNSLIALSKQALREGPDLLVWPEAALPGSFARTRSTQELVTGLVQEGKVWMIFGAEDSGRRIGPEGQEVIDYLNSAFLVNPAGDLVARYHKRHLVAFGEYMPGARWLPFLKRFREKGGGLAQGRGPVAFQLGHGGAKVSALICFEDVFPHLAREHVDEDTDFLVNLTNNGWFGESAAQWQHAVSALFRAVENGVPLVRCANNGLSCWIDARGRMHELYFPGSRDIYQAGFKVAQVPLRAAGEKGQSTIYNQYGDWFGWSCVAFTAAGMTGLTWLRKRKVTGKYPRNQETVIH